MSKPIRRFNRGYSGGFPIPVGDRYFTQDLLRDQAYLEGMIGIAYNDLTQQTAPYVISGLKAFQGTGHTIDITAGKAVVPFTVTIPDTAAAWTDPPSTTTANIDMVIDYAGVTGASLAGTVTDGATPNYVKLSYTETNGNTRARAKKAGTYAYEVYDSVTLTINSTAPAANEITLLTFTTDGATVTITNTGDTRIGSPFRKQNAVAYSQATFNDMIERVAANQYKIRDDITSLYCAYLSGGYLMTGGTSPLSGGDTWGYIETNNCQNIIFDSGAFIDMGNERGYLEVNTDYCYLRNVNITGTGTVASAIVQSFLLNADYVTFLNCKSSSRLSTGNFGVFHGSSTASHNDTSTYLGCVVFDIETQAGSSNGGFYECKNLTGCKVIDLTYSGAASSGYGFFNCDIIENCIIDTMSGAGLNTQAFRSCDNVANCIAKNITSTLNDCEGFRSCKHLTNCNVDTISSNSGNVFAYNSCTKVTGCYANAISSSAGITYGFYSCVNVSNCIGESISSSADHVYAFWTCTEISNCKATSIEHDGSVASKNSYGFYNCTDLSSCKSTDIDTNGAGGVNYGFSTCTQISSCYATNTKIGFVSCDQISSSIAISNSDSGFYLCNRINTSLSQNNTLYGFVTCKQLSTNRATGNGSGQYNASYADSGTSNAAADTASGGYNS